ncbi:MAG: HlyC/CorC family transporter [Candidatus Eisenbacteria bacterium]|uniref:HlyC/CorC family transporter n=1 Tax=Eiseniibacteriota bacterium TaxID=2212470 RepID=A0A7Y2EBC6_UNCEI|nr:HlyC/CorC family transporter [Candidatus Eisenbacteria bacterium]
MSPETVWLLALFVVLLLLSGTFSGSETALFSLNRMQIGRFARSTSRRERWVAAVAARPERLLAGILLGNTLVNVASSSVAVALATRLDNLASADTLVLAAVVCDTLLLLVAGEIFPKGLAVHWPAMVAKFYIPFLRPLLRGLRPVAQVLEAVARFLLRGVGVQFQAGRAGLTRPELELLFEDMLEAKGFSEREGVIASNIFDFFETRAWEIMTPRVDVLGVEVGLERSEIIQKVVDARHARLPVYRESVDQIIGYISSKEFLLDPDLPMEQLIKPVHFVPERARVHGILSEVQARKLSVVVVVNEFGGTSGIITLEDLIEEVVGEIFDETEVHVETELHPIDESSWNVSGLLPIHELAEELNLKAPEGPAQTIAGHVAHLLGRPPKVGDIVEDSTLGFEVLEVSRHRARRLVIRRLPRSHEDEDR